MFQLWTAKIFQAIIPWPEWSKNCATLAETSSTICRSYKFLSSPTPRKWDRKQKKRKQNKNDARKKYTIAKPSDAHLSRIDGPGELLVIHWAITVLCTRTSTVASVGNTSAGWACCCVVCSALRPARIYTPRQTVHGIVTDGHNITRWIGRRTNNQNPNAHCTFYFSPLDCDLDIRIKPNTDKSSERRKRNENTDRSRVDARWMMERTNARNNEWRKRRRRRREDSNETRVRGRRAFMSHKVSRASHDLLGGESTSFAWISHPRWFTPLPSAASEQSQRAKEEGPGQKKTPEFLGITFARASLRG